MNRDAKIYIAGHRGLVGSALVRRLAAEGFENLVMRAHADLDLTVASSVDDFFLLERPDYVFLAAARVGGILANQRHPADFLRDNLLIQTNVIDAAHRAGVKKLLFLGSSCIYPREAPQPIQEDSLLSGPLEPTNEAYAIAKIAGIRMAQAYRAQYGMNAICLMPTNLYGPGDDFDLQRSHVLPALLRKFHEAKTEGRTEVVVWGTGAPRREFLHVDDLAAACLFLMRTYDKPDLVNVGVGEDLSIRELVALVSDIVGWSGTVRFDSAMPDGTPRKVLDVTRIHALGWRACVPLRRGIEETYAWYVEKGSRGRDSS